MNFRIANTFTESLSRLQRAEQKAAKMAAFDLQLDPANPGMRLHRLERARDRGFWSVRASRDVRLIVHRSRASLLLCYVGHHDDAYRWAERRKLEVHPATGAAQLVEVRELVREVVVPETGPAVVRAATSEPMFAAFDDDQILSWGVPEEWLADVRNLRDEDGLLTLTDHLPEEAAEALLEVATGGSPPAPSEEVEKASDPFEHPDALRRFRIMDDRDELERALEFPWEKWAIFLHPAQREWVEKEHQGPARVAGSAGTGKTVVALHRAVHLAGIHEDSRILLATFSDTLAAMLKTKLRRLLYKRPQIAERIDVSALDSFGIRLYATRFGSVHVASAVELNGLLEIAASAYPDHGFSTAFLRDEWAFVIDAWQVGSLEAYLAVRRLGRRTQLPPRRREAVWPVFAQMRQEMRKRGWTSLPTVFARLTEDIGRNDNPPFQYAVIDEAQDLSVTHLRFLAAVAGERPDGLFFAGDLGQRIFQQPFSWKSLGVDVRGRARILRINYRTSHQIRRQADRLLDGDIEDVDGNVEVRSETVSVFNGPEPEVCTFASLDAEAQAVAEWLKRCAEDGFAAEELGVFVRSRQELDRARTALEATGLPFVVLDEMDAPVHGSVTVSTMHRAKGLEFRGVAVMACDDEVVPSQERIESVGDEAALEDVYNTERHLLYVACTRARDRLLVTARRPESEFLLDFQHWSRQMPA